MITEHYYTLLIEWTGNIGIGTKDYQSYNRNFEIRAERKQTILSSADPAFRGDVARYNPEEMFLAAIASCHMLWYLHLCADKGIVVTAYSDNPKGTLKLSPDGSGFISGVTLYPAVTIKNEQDAGSATDLHLEANRMCFIANSCRFKVDHQPLIRFDQRSSRTVF